MSPLARLSGGPAHIGRTEIAFSPALDLDAGPPSDPHAITIASQRPACAPELTHLAPVALADLMLAGTVLQRADAATLKPRGEGYVMSMSRGGASICELFVTGEQGAAAAARLSVAAELDPFAGAGGLRSRMSAARVAVGAGDATGDLLVAIAALPEGLDVEVRVLSIDGGAPPSGGRPSLVRCVQCGTLQLAQRRSCSIDGAAVAELPDDPRPGGNIGVYRVTSVIGDGGMGTVFAGEHALMGRPVAIKLLHRAFANVPSVVGRFLVEARATALLHHPNIVEVTDYGLLDDGLPYLVMERLEGAPLDTRFDRDGALSPLEALLVAREIALALGAAHAAGVLHNDLKPANVMLLSGSTAEAPRIKLLDFGAALLARDAGAANDDLVIGTPRYMAPERVRGQPGDGRSDLYALGVLLYEAIAGQGPITGNSVEATLLAQVNQVPPPLTSPFGALPPMLPRLIARALEKAPEARHQRAEELIADIDRCLEALRRSGWRRWLP